MSDQREPDRANAPDAEESTNTTDVRDAIERAKEANAEHASASEASTGFAESHTAPAVQQHVSNDVHQSPVEHTPPTAEPVTPPVQPPAVVQHPETQMPSASEPVYPQAGAQPGPHATTHPGTPVQIDPDHPMAALYIQQPMPPTLRGNRLGGVLISLLASLGFAVVYAGIIAIWRALQFPPSTYLQEGLLPFLTSLGFVLPVLMFLIAMILLVLVVNRAGWWAYVLGGFIVALLVWVAAGAGYALSPQLGNLPSGADGDMLREITYGLGYEKVKHFAFTLPALMAGLAAREVSVWFGAWIGARGRRVTARNAEAMKEYEAKLVEVQAKLS